MKTHGSLKHTLTSYQAEKTRKNAFIVFYFNVFIIKFIVALASMIRKCYLEYVVKFSYDSFQKQAIKFHDWLKISTNTQWSVTVVIDEHFSYTYTLI